MKKIRLDKEILQNYQLKELKTSIFSTQLNSHHLLTKAITHTVKNYSNKSYRDQSNQY